MYPDTMVYEYMLRQFLGKKAYNTEWSQFSNSNKAWIKKCISEISQTIDWFDTDLRHKELMLNSIQWIRYLLSVKKNDERNLWYIIFYLLDLISRILGYDYLLWKKIRTIAYFQTQWQNYSEHYHRGDDMTNYLYGKNIVSQRRKIYTFLKQDWLSDYEISEILNISEYEIKKIKNMQSRE